MDRIAEFEEAQKEICKLDFRGEPIRGEAIFSQFKRRNSFGLDRDKKLHRIFQSKFLEDDIAGRFLTLPRARAALWKDHLENPLSSVFDVDIATGYKIHLGSLVSSFHALCWTHRQDATPADWHYFSHGTKSVRISTTVGKLMDRVMRLDDPAFASRAWLVEVEYNDPSLIEQLRHPAEVYRRMRCQQGALLALSAAVVRTEHSHEDEVRLLFDPAVIPAFATIPTGSPDLIRIPFNWDGFIVDQEDGPV